MCKRIAVWLALLLILPIAVGCESSVDSGGDDGPSVEELTAQFQGKTNEATPAADSQPENNAAASVDSRDNAPGRDASAQVEGGVPEDAKKASDRPPAQASRGYLGAVSGANRNIRIMADDLPWKKSVQLFEAEHGHKPRDTKEFMERIQREDTPLPDIPEGTTYHYEPDEGQFGELYHAPIDPPAGGPESK